MKIVKDIIEKVEAMRIAQKKHSVSKNRESLETAKDLEREVDDMIKHLKSERKQLYMPYLEGL